MTMTLDAGEKSAPLVENGELATADAMVPAPAEEVTFIRNLFKRAQAYIEDRPVARLPIEGHLEIVTTHTDTLGRPVVSFGDMVTETTDGMNVEVISIAQPPDGDVPLIDRHSATYRKGADAALMSSIREGEHTAPTDNDLHHLHLAGAALRDLS